MSDRDPTDEVVGKLIKPIDTTFRPNLLMALGWAIAIAGIASLVYFVLHFNDVELFFSLIKKANPLWLGAALICQMLTYVAASLVWKIVLDRAHSGLPFAALLKIGFLQLFANQLLPTSGLSGTIIVLRALTRRGIDAGVVLAGLFLDTLSYYTVYLILALIAFAMLWHRHVSSFDWLPILVAFVLLMATILASVSMMSRTKDRILPPFLLRWRPVAYLAVWLQEMDPRAIGGVTTILWAASCQCAVFLLDAATLWCVAHSIGVQLDAVGALSSFLIASVVATLAPLPLGLGSFETTCIVALHLFGVGPEAGLAATLMLRGLTLWLPMLPGLVLTRSEIIHRRRTDSAPDVSAGTTGT
ncbi:lysylphosphatidylglycerol synthase transmembrane domain-containing protein (plasmid) [Agrobacterium vitis]|uniref:lysylphosphatidylglycerol synthase transmembrane domain-containing protein n=1 Tax=Agrobacterium vitis TaxID=373 RepID=UPI003D2DDA0E